MSRQCMRIFSGIQPTGVPHLGNYFGAIERWIEISKERRIHLVEDSELGKAGASLNCEIPIYSIVDVHAYSSLRPCPGHEQRKKILSTAGSLLALGLDPNKCILFRQSAIHGHSHLCVVLTNFVSDQRLRRMTQFKEKSETSSLVKTGLLNYPVLQAADILLYRSNIVPVGEDQKQHIELCREIAKKFNSLTNSDLFPQPIALLDKNKYSRRVKSLRDPEKKMSKSDPNLKSFIQIIDEPDVIVEKCKKALTDSNSAVYYDLDNRLGVSNLMIIYHLATGDSLDEITKKFRGRDTGYFKLELADVLIEKFKGPRDEYKHLINNPEYLSRVLREGANKALPIAAETINSVEHLLGSDV